MLSKQIKNQILTENFENNKYYNSFLKKYIYKNSEIILMNKHYITNKEQKLTHRVLQKLPN